MAPDRNQRYDAVPPIPSYDEAMAADAGIHDADAESQSLLQTGQRGSANLERPRRPAGYRPPTVESDDEDGLFSSESDEDYDDHVEAAHVRREMQELEVMDSIDGAPRHFSAIIGKAIGSLPRWKWTWRWRLPKLRIRLPDGPSPSDSTDTTPQRRRQCPSIDPGVAFLLVGRVLAIFLVLGFLYLLFMSDVFANMSRRLGGHNFDPESVRMHIQASVDSDRMQEHLRHFTSYAHMAGSEGDFALAEDVKNLFFEYGLEHVTVDEYYVYLNYPKAGGRAVEILGADGQPTWSAKIEEEEVGAETRGHQTLAFHGLSKSGDVKGPLIYANYGSREDFKRLHDSGIDTRGAIALVRYYGTQPDRGLKVKAAELAGFAGCIIYSDPKDDGFLLGSVAPEGRYMPPDGVQRGSVGLGWVIGDMLTPGWESKKDLPRMEPEQSPGLVQIPSIPLAWRDAQVLLQHLQGFGTPVPEEWEGGVPDIEKWWSGNLSSPIVHLKNEQDEVQQQPIWNVYGKIVGDEQPAKSIIIGNHRDAWSFGATDPGSGTVILLEMARIFGDLLRRGWRPLRSIEFMSWDAEEYNLIGSTEFVENNLDALRADAVAYINLDTAVTGNTFRAEGSPVFRRLIMQILKRVSDPNTNGTLRDLWDERGDHVGDLGAGSDYVAFQNIAGTSSLDLHFDGPAFPLHSSYDTFNWMDRIGDPGFVYHTLLGQILGLLIVELADRPILPFDMIGFAEDLEEWVEDLVGWSENKGANQDGNAPLDFSVLKAAANVVSAAVREFDKWEAEWEHSVLSTNAWEPIGLGHQREEYNTRMSKFDTDLLDTDFGGGVPNRTQFRHVIYGPQLWNSYDAAFFPAIRDAIDARDWDLANKTVDKVANIIQKAAAGLME